MPRRAEMRTAIVSLALLAAMPLAAQPDMAKYQQSCAVCHAYGAAGAQKSHDLPAWEPLLAKGMEALLSNVKSGVNGMPPRGLCGDCTDADFENLIRFMAAPE